MNKFHTIIVCADFMSSGLWIPRPLPDHPHADFMIEHESLNLPEELSVKLNNWINRYDDVCYCPEKFDCEKFNTIGVMLAAELQQFLGEPHLGAPLVLFRPELLRSVEECKKYYRGE